MSQQRECCCGEVAGVEISCVNSDKIFRHMEEEPQGDPFGKSYRSTTPTTAYAINPLMLGASHVQEMFGHQYYRTNRPQLTDGPPGSNVKKTHGIQLV